MNSNVFSDNAAAQNTNRRIWGRRQSRPLNPQRAAAMERIFPHLKIDATRLTEKGDLDPAALFPPDAPVWMEIGFGSGEHVIGLLDQNPKICMLAAEPFLNGMAAFVKDVPQIHHNRVRVIMDDAMLLAHSLADNSIERLYILNPDPWHKKRHYKRRIVSPDNLDTFARILKPGGHLIMTSDVLDLADWMVTHTFKHPAFTWTAQDHNDWSKPPKDWIATRYETKGAKGAKKMCYLTFIRR